VAPISSKRYYPLRRLNVESKFNMQMGVLEGVVDTPVVMPHFLISTEFCFSQGKSAAKDLIQSI
jgi:hypothetical protein